MCTGEMNWRLGLSVKKKESCEGRRGCCKRNGKEDGRKKEALEEGGEGLEQSLKECVESQGRNV